MATLLPDAEENLTLHPDDLISLKEARIPGGAFAMRELDKDQLESLTLSDPATWPPLLVTLCTSGYIVIDGYHRWHVAQEQERWLKANCKAYQSENDVVEAAFRANLQHGLKASKESKGDYAYWLHVTYPSMEQTEIAARVGMTQGGVSKAITRRDEEARRVMKGEQEQASEERQERIVQSCRKLARVAGQFLTDIDELENGDVAEIMNRAIKKPEEKAKLLRLGQLLLYNDPLSLESPITSRLLR